MTLPSGWRFDRIKDVAALRTAKTNAKSEIEDYLELEDIESWRMRILNRRNTLEVESAVTLFKAGDVLFGKLRPYLAKVCRPDFDGKCTGEILAIRPTHVDGGYLKYALIDPEIIKRCTEFSYGAKMPRINWATQLSTFPIAIPPLPEQRRIAAYLDAKCADVDKAIAAKQRQVEMIETLWKNVLHDATLHGVGSRVPRDRAGRDGVPSPSENTAAGGGTPALPSMCHTRTNEWIGQIPCGWHDVRLKDLFTYAKGLNITKADLVEDGVAVVSYGQIHAKQNTGVHLGSSLVRFVPEELIQDHSSSRLAKGDIVFADTSEDLEGIGNCVLNDSDETVYAGYHALVAKARFPEYSKYLSYLFQTDAWRSQIRTRVCGIKVFSLTQRTLNGVTVLLPPLSEQRQIAAYLDAKRAGFDALAGNLRRQVETLEQYRRSLIHECVTGKRRCA